MTAIITVRGLRKSFKDVHAVRGIDFSVEQGALFAFLGPNGAGKSTTIEMLCTLIKPDGGEVLIGNCMLGHDDDAIRSKIGIVFQGSVLDPLLTVRENLQTRAHFYHMDKVQRTTAVREAALASDVMEFIDRPYGKLSGGQRRRADIARALINTPQVLFMDEPTTGLDPKTKESVWQTVIDLQKRTGMTVFLTTHYMEEAALADFVTIIRRGEIAAQGTPYELRERYSSDTLRLKSTEEAVVIRLLEEARLAFKVEGTLVSVVLSDTMAALPILEKVKPHIAGFEVVHGSMEDAFLALVGEEDVDG